MKMLMILLVAALALTMAGCKNESSTVGREDGGTLTLQQPGDVTITQGGTAEVNVSIDKKNMNDPVAISFDKLPSGVTVVDSTIKILGDKGTYILKADDMADVVSDYQSQVTAKSTGGVAATTTVKITVKAKN